MKPPSVCRETVPGAASGKRSNSSSVSSLACIIRGHGFRDGGLEQSAVAAALCRRTTKGTSKDEGRMQNEEGKPQSRQVSTSRGSLHEALTEPSRNTSG